jgi:hypothetical protein
VLENFIYVGVVQKFKCGSKIYDFPEWWILYDSKLGLGQLSLGSQTLGKSNAPGEIKRSSWGIPT